MNQHTAIAASLLFGIATACVATPPGERFLIAPLPALAPFERTDFATGKGFPILGKLLP